VRLFPVTAATGSLPGYAAEEDVETGVGATADDVSDKDCCAYKKSNKFVIKP
jgi:hypothetical protein